MAQTLLALLALVLSSFVVLNQKQLTMRSYRVMVADEMEIAASGLASDIVEFIAARSFDENTTPGAILGAGRVPTGPESFSALSTFGSNTPGACDLQEPANTTGCNDVDDLAGLDWQQVSLGIAAGRSVEFEVRTDVRYVTDPSGLTTSLKPTLHKRLDLDVRSRHVTGRPDGFVHITRVISYDPVKAEMDFERVYGPLGTDGGMVVH